LSSETQARTNTDNILTSQIQSLQAQSTNYVLRDGDILDGNYTFNGNIKINDGTQGSGKVLTSDDNGLASWQTPAGGSGDNLGNHIATTTLNMNGNDITNVANLTTNGNVGIGTTNPQAKLDVAGNVNAVSYLINNSTMVAILSGNNSIAYGVNAGINNAGDNNVFIGNYAGVSNITGNSNTANGSYALYSNTTGNSNTANGYLALYSNTDGNSNTANGSNALYSNTMGSDNTANGSYALYSNIAGNSNTANGYFALYSNIDGNDNTAIGINAGYNLTTGSYNIFLGEDAGYNITNGNNNIIIGYNQNTPTDTIDNFLNIGGLIYGTNMVSGGSGGNVGIGTSSPQAKLDVAGTIQVSSTTTSSTHICIAGAFDTLPISGYNKGCIAYQNSDNTLYVSTEDVVGIESWKPL
jgi:hypothetical protein